MELKAFQLWFNDNTGELYEVRHCQGEFIFYTAVFRGMFMPRGFVDNPDNEWFFIGDL